MLFRRNPYPPLPPLGIIRLVVRKKANSDGLQTEEKYEKRVETVKKNAATRRAQKNCLYLQTIRKELIAEMENSFWFQARIYAKLD